MLLEFRQAGGGIGRQNYWDKSYGVQKVNFPAWNSITYLKFPLAYLQNVISFMPSAKEENMLLLNSFLKSVIEQLMKTCCIGNSFLSCNNEFYLVCFIYSKELYVNHR